MAPAPAGAVRTKRTTSTDPSASCRSFAVHSFGIGFGIFMALQPEDAIALRSRGRYTQVPEPTEEYIRLTRLEGIVVSVLCAVLLVVLLFAPT